MKQYLKFFYSRKLAIVLLLLISGLALLETIVLRHILLKSLYTRWWFVLIWLALFLNIFFCNYLRTRKLWKRYKQKPKIYFSYNEPQCMLKLNDLPKDYVKSFKEILKSKGYKIQSDENEIIGYKGRWAEIWSIIFHLSFLIIVLGILYHQLTFFRGTLVLTEAQSVIDNTNNYLYHVKRKWVNDKSNYSIKLLDLKVDYYDSGDMKDLSGKLELSKGDKKQEKKVRVNYPIYYADRKIILQDYDYAPRFILFNKQGKVKWHSHVALDLISNTKLREGTFTIPNTDLMVKVHFFPDYYIYNGKEISKSLEPFNPRFELLVYKNSNVIAQKYVNLNEPVKFNDGSILVTDLRYWGKFNISSEKGIRIIYFGFWLGIIGLAFRIFIRYKRVGIKFVDDEKDRKLLIDCKIDIKSALFKKEIISLAQEFSKKEGVKWQQ